MGWLPPLGLSASREILDHATMCRANQEDGFATCSILAPVTLVCFCYTERNQANDKWYITLRLWFPVKKPNCRIQVFRSLTLTIVGQWVNRIMGRQQCWLVYMEMSICSVLLSNVSFIGVKRMWSFCVIFDIFPVWQNKLCYGFRITVIALRLCFVIL